MMILVVSMVTVTIVKRHLQQWQAQCKKGDAENLITIVAALLMPCATLIRHCGTAPITFFLILAYSFTACLVCFHSKSK